MDITQTLCIVCGENADEEIMSEYRGVTYFFSSRNCKEKFDKNPERYVDINKK